MHPRLQNFKSVSEYNFVLFKISSLLKLCGEKVTDDDLLEKTYTTFHASNLLLQQQYRKRKFKKYSELISCLLVAEQNNKILLRNHQSRPTGSISFPEVNGTRFTPFPEANGTSFQRNRGRGRGRKNYRSGSPRSDHTKVDNIIYTPYHQKWFNLEKGKCPQNKFLKKNENGCHRYGMTGHWSRTCRTAKHLVDLY
ncbi:hypothetical protein I3760_05G174700 [Carya illinoinensis]|nr:hypothetical protein I3760_05G174700 [Carya illinoinensis]